MQGPWGISRNSSSWDNNSTNPGSRKETRLLFWQFTRSFMVLTWPLIQHWWEEERCTKSRFTWQLHPKDKMSPHPDDEQTSWGGFLISDCCFGKMLSDNLPNKLRSLFILMYFGTALGRKKWFISGKTMWNPFSHNQFIHLAHCVLSYGHF